MKMVQWSEILRSRCQNIDDRNKKLIECISTTHKYCFDLLNPNKLSSVNRLIEVTLFEHIVSEEMMMYKLRLHNTGIHAEDHTDLLSTAALLRKKLKSYTISYDDFFDCLYYRLVLHILRYDKKLCISETSCNWSNSTPLDS